MKKIELMGDSGCSDLVWRECCLMMLMLVNMSVDNCEQVELIELYFYDFVHAYCHCEQMNDFRVYWQKLLQK